MRTSPADVAEFIPAKATTAKTNAVTPARRCSIISPSPPREFSHVEAASITPNAILWIAEIRSTIKASHHSCALELLHNNNEILPAYLFATGFHDQMELLCCCSATAPAGRARNGDGIPLHAL